MLAEADSTVLEIASVTGHSQKHAQPILDKYLVRTRLLADAAIFRREQHPRFLQKGS